MKLLLIYGSPAVGKLTVAEEIARRTGFRVFHNHLTIDALTPVFEFGTPPFWKLVHLMRVETVREAARAGVDLIYTFCYAKDHDDAHVAEIVEAVESGGGEVLFVLLTADRSVIERRVGAPSRTRHGKLKSVETLREMFARYELFAPVNGRTSLVVDNTHLTAGETAQQIIAHFFRPAVLSDAFELS